MPRIATIQMVSTASLEENLDSASILLQQAAEQGAELALLPEYFPIISDDECAKLRYQEPFGCGPLQAYLADKAKVHGLWLIGGTIPLASGDPERVLNSCLLFNPQGERVARYDKIHLFDVSVDSHGDESYNESTTIAPGNEVVVAATPFGNIGMSICYDLRFPELYRQMLDQDIVMITVPAAFTYTTGKRHWEMLLRTRAVENLCFAIGSNQGGQNTDNHRTWGHSMIVDPWGDILCSLEEGPGVVCADVDINRVRELRRSFPAINHRKL